MSLESDSVRRGGDALHSLLRTVLDATLPPRCLACGTVVGSGHSGVSGLCASCWIGITFIDAPACAQCGYPFELDFGPGTKCGACLSDRPDYDRLRAALAYDDASRPLFLAFKHGDRMDMGPGLARMLLRPGAALLAEADIVAPVPLHRTRLRERRFNQAAVMARLLAGTTDKDFYADLLIRGRATRPQGKLSRSARARNVAGAFDVAPRHRGNLEGRRVLLIDDVVTTGATVNACAKVLRRHGASGVDVLALGRVVRPTAAG